MLPECPKPREIERGQPQGEQPECTSRGLFTASPDRWVWSNADTEELYCTSELPLNTVLFFR